MTIETLQYVYTAYKCGSYKEAAFALSVTYSVVAKQVSRAEEELGVRIFERASKSKEMKLTPAGENLMGEIGTILESYRRIQNSIQAFGHGGQKKLYISYGYYMTCEEEIEIMLRFTHQYPHITLSQKRGSSGERRKQMALHSIDGMFTAFMGENWHTELEYEFPDAEYDRILVSNVCQMHFLMSGGNPLVRYPALSRAQREEILKQTFLIMNTADGEVRKVPPFLAEYLGIGSDQMKVRFIDSSNLPLLPDILASGSYLLPLARRCTRPPEQVTAVPVTDWTTQVRLYFISRKLDTSQALKAFRKCVQEYAGQNRTQVTVQTAVQPWRSGWRCGN